MSGFSVHFCQVYEKCAIAFHNISVTENGNLLGHSWFFTERVFWKNVQRKIVSHVSADEKHPISSHTWVKNDQGNLTMERMIFC